VQLLFIIGSLYLRLLGSESLTSIVVYGALWISFQVVFYAILLIISCGWGISRDSFDRDKYAIGGITVGLFLALLATFLLRGYFNLLMLVMYIVIIVMIFRYTNKNLLGLGIAMRNQIESPDSQDSRTRNTAKDKYRMFTTYKVIMLAYLALSMVILLISIIFLQPYYQWIYTMLSELLDVMMFICIGWTFRLRSVNIYYRLNSDEDPPYYSANNNQVIELQPASVPVPLEDQRPDSNSIPNGTFAVLPPTQL